MQRVLGRSAGFAHVLSSAGAKGRLGLALLALFALVGGGCHSAGPYDHDVNYVPLSPEEKASKAARDYDPVMYQRKPEEWHAHPASLFGVVTNRGTAPAGGAYVTLSVRRLETRNVCENANDLDTCRTTVSDHDFGVVHARLSLAPDDDIGPLSIGIGSLLRVIGVFAEEGDPADGAPILKATYYRHWPRYYFVTKASARDMRQ
jgi:hypothetical protein